MTEARTNTQLAETFAEIARTLGVEDSVPATLHKICDLAVRTLPHCDSAGITVIEGRSIENLAATDQIPVLLDQLQMDADQGPCLDAIRLMEVFQTPDLAVEDRWPDFSTRAVEQAGVHSMLCFRLFLEEDTYGALNLYSHRVAAFDDDDVSVGVVFAAHAAVAMRGAHQRAEIGMLQDEAAALLEVGQAMGILMAHGRTSGQAMAALMETARRLDVRLRDVAEDFLRARPTANADYVPPAATPRQLD